MRTDRVKGLDDSQLDTHVAGCRRSYCCFHQQRADPSTCASLPTTASKARHQGELRSVVLWRVVLPKVGPEGRNSLYISPV